MRRKEEIHELTFTSKLASRPLQTHHNNRSEVSDSKKRGRRSENREKKKIKERGRRENTIRKRRKNNR